MFACSFGVDGQVREQNLIDSRKGASARLDHAVSPRPAELLELEILNGPLRLRAALAIDDEGNRRSAVLRLDLVQRLLHRADIFV